MAYKIIAICDKCFEEFDQTEEWLRASRGKEGEKWLLITIPWEWECSDCLIGEAGGRRYPRENH